MHSNLLLPDAKQVRSGISKYLALVFVPSGIVLSQRLKVFACQTFDYFAILQCDLHYSWARRNSSTLKADLSYSNRDAFLTFPLPEAKPVLGHIGETYHEHRRQVMLTRQEGLTATYNRFHDPEETAADIARLRELHIEMDNAVAAAYGWQDLDLGHGFHETRQGQRFTISEAARREVLTRLLQLNHERYAEEVRQGLHEKKKKRSSRKGGRRKKGTSNKKDERQMEMF